MLGVSRLMSPTPALAVQPGDPVPPELKILMRLNFGDQALSSH
jgi:hypothetical protein